MNGWGWCTNDVLQLGWNLNDDLRVVEWRTKCRNCKSQFVISNSKGIKHERIAAINCLKYRGKADPLFFLWGGTWMSEHCRYSGIWQSDHQSSRGNEKMIEAKSVISGNKQIRRTLHNGELWFSISDVVDALIETPNSADYIDSIILKDKSLAKAWKDVVIPLWFTMESGSQKVDCANTEGIFRITQSIPAQKAEPLKRWLARMAYERIQEIKNSDLAPQRTRTIYKSRGNSDAWIEKRMYSIKIRSELLNVWHKRGVQEDSESTVLTAEIARATFGMTPEEYKRFKEWTTEICVTT